MSPTARYDGPRAGRIAAIWSLARWSSLRALGARRGWKAKVIPITLILLGFAPALVVLGLRALFGATAFGTGGLQAALPYSDYMGAIGVVILVFSVVVTPELVCPDRRDRTLSLYFSTAISRGDYVVGKVVAALMPILLVTLAAAADPLRRERALRHPPARLRRASTGRTSPGSSGRGS